MALVFLASFPLILVNNSPELRRMSQNPHQTPPDTPSSSGLNAPYLFPSMQTMSAAFPSFGSNPQATVPSIQPPLTHSNLWVPHNGGVAPQMQANPTQSSSHSPVRNVFHSLQSVIRTNHLFQNTIADPNLGVLMEEIRQIRMQFANMDRQPM